jgi:bacillithiol synthase
MKLSQKQATIEGEGAKSKLFPSALKSDVQLSGVALVRRMALAALLREELEAPCQAELDALDALCEKDCDVFVTGQQAGLLLGPAYTLNKILALLAVKKQIENETGRSAVCVFWLEASDHDWQEVACIQGPRSRPFTLKAESDQLGKSLGHCDLSTVQQKNLNMAIAENAEFWPKDLCGALEKAAEQKTLPAHFHSLLRSLFKQSALLILDPSRPSFRSLVLPFFEKLHAQSPRFKQALQQDAERLVAEGKTLSVTLDERADWFQVDASGKRLRPHPTARLASDQDLSSTVLSRPLLQDWLLAPRMSLLGQGELAYHEQIKKAGSLLEIPRSLALARPLMHWIKSEDKTIFEEAGLSWMRCPQPGQPWPDAFLEGLDPSNQLGTRSASLYSHEESLAKLFASLTEEVTAPQFAKLAQRFSSLFDQTQNRLREAVRAKHKAHLRDLHRLGDFHNGAKGAQERRVNSFVLLAVFWRHDLIAHAVEALSQRLLVQCDESAQASPLKIHLILGSEEAQQEKGSPHEKTIHLIEEGT